MITFLPFSSNGYQQFQDIVEILLELLSDVHMILFRFFLNSQLGVVYNIVYLNMYFKIKVEEDRCEQPFLNCSTEMIIQNQHNKTDFALNEQYKRRF